MQGACVGVVSSVPDLRAQGEPRSRVEVSHVGVLVWASQCSNTEA